MEPVAIGRVMWPGPIGVGAGLVKNGIMLLDYAKRAHAVEIGSITRHLREGNGGQVVWKYPEEKSLRHNAGMPNYGAEHLAEDLVKVQDQVTVPWGINIAVSPGIFDPQEAAADIRGTIHVMMVAGLAPDWITFNVSSPDTEDPVNMVSEPIRVMRCIDAIKSEIVHHDNPPLWLKVGPSMPTTRLRHLANLAVGRGIEAIVCGNTMPDKRGGGWCGQAAKGSANATLWWLKQYVRDNLPLVGVGGVLTGKDARHKFGLGATAVQVVSAMLIRGRDAVREIEQEL